jgi:hypothetical protein
MNIKENKKIFQEKGYLLLKNFFSSEQLEKITKISNNVLDKGILGKWKYVRIYRDYPNFFGKLNLFGIDYPLNKSLDQNLYDEFQNLKYKANILNILGWKNFYTPLIRLHTNSSFYNYQGEWHRDDDNFPSPNSIQVIIYLMNEEGYKIIPKNKNHLLEKHGIQMDKERNAEGEFYKLPDNIYDVVKAEKGDIFLHESSLLHQGFCKKKRLHFHLRHIRNDELINKDSNDKYNFTKFYKKDFDLEVNKIKQTYDFSTNFIKRLIQLKSFLQYFFPRFKSIKNNLFKKEKHSVFHSTFWQ